MSDVTKLLQYGSLIIGFDFSKNEDGSILIVGMKTPGNSVEVVNAFQGKKAVEMYSMLTNKKEG